jgi:hypothetical protein
VRGALWIAHPIIVSAASATPHQRQSAFPIFIVILLSLLVLVIRNRNS